MTDSYNLKVAKRLLEEMALVADDDLCAHILAGALASRGDELCPPLDLADVHIVLRRVWNREISADDALDEIENIVEG